MNRRGEELSGPGLLVVIALVLLAFMLLAGALWWASGGQKQGATCTKQGGTCRSVCADGERFAPEGLFCDTGHCCKPVEGDGFSVGGDGGTSGTGGTNPDGTPVLPQVQAPTIQIRAAQTKQETSSLSLVPQQEQEIIVTIRTESNTPTMANCPKATNTTNGFEVVSSEICAGQWKKKFTLQDARGVTLYEWYTRQGDADVKTTSVLPVLTVSSPQGGLTKTKEGNLYIITSTYTLNPNFTLAQNNQNFRLVVTVYPGEQVGNSPSLETERFVNLKVTNGIRVSGLTNNWERSKTLRVDCDGTTVSCSQFYYYITGTGKCLPAGSLKLSESPQPVRQRTSQYCITGTQTCFEQQGQCQLQLSQQPQTADYNKVIQDFLGAMGMSTPLPLDDPRLIALSNSQVTNGAVTCEERYAYSQSDIDVFTSASTRPTFYAAESFDTAAQSGMLVLSHPLMQNRSICLYAQDASLTNENGLILHQAMDAKRIYIDTEPPNVTLKFEPWKLKIHYICIDSLSGCKDLVGVAYISQVKEFLQAVFRGPQSASTWCPQTGYAPHNQGESVYTDKDVRVLCMRGEDIAGNNATTMVTVYNSYQVLATIIAEVQKNQ